MTDSLKQRILDDMKAALKGGDKPRLGVLRMVSAAIKQVEVDQRIEVDDPAVLSVLQKMRKQRRDSLQQFQDAGRQDLADQEAFEIRCIEAYMPQPLNDRELDALVEQAITESGADGMKDMGKVMALLKARTQGRADMGSVSARVKQRLS